MLVCLKAELFSVSHAIVFCSLFSLYVLFQACWCDYDTDTPENVVYVNIVYFATEKKL